MPAALWGVAGLGLALALPAAPGLAAEGRADGGSAAAGASRGHGWLAWGVSHDASRIDLRWGADIGPVGRVDARGDLALTPLRRPAWPEWHWVPAEGPSWSLVSQRFGGQAEARLARELAIEGERFPVDAEARSRFVFEGATLGWTWWQDEGPGHALGLGLGLAHYRFRATIALRVEDEAEGAERRGEGRLSGAAWLPQLRFVQQWTARGGHRLWWELQGLARPEGGIRGHALEARAGLDLWGAGATGLGLRWRAIDIDLERGRIARGSGALRYRAHGPELVLLARWD